MIVMVVFSSIYRPTKGQILGEESRAMLCISVDIPSRSYRLSRLNRITRQHTVSPLYVDLYSLPNPFLQEKISFSITILF